MTIDLQTQYAHDSSMVYREIAGEAILVPIRQHKADLDSIYTLDEVGAFVWSLIDGRRTVQDLVAAVLDEYDVGPQEVEADLTDFLRDLEQIGALRSV